MCKAVPLNPRLDTQISGLRFKCAKLPAVFNEITALFTLLKIITMWSSSHCLFAKGPFHLSLQISKHFVHNKTDIPSWMIRNPSQSTAHFLALTANLFLPPLPFSHSLCLLILSQLLDFPHKLVVTGPAFHLNILPQDCNYLFSFTLCFSPFAFSLALECCCFPYPQSIHYSLSLFSLSAFSRSP